MTDLGEYLRAAGYMRRRAGQHDCCTFPAGWAIICGHPDPMAEWRGTYDSEAEAEALIFDAGGLDALFARGMAGAGIPEASAPFEPGDIAVVEAAGFEAGSIFTGRRWAFVADRGVAFGSLEEAMIKRAWRPGHG